jgi:hypothetical protein
MLLYQSSSCVSNCGDDCIGGNHRVSDHLYVKHYKNCEKTPEMSETNSEATRSACWCDHECDVHLRVSVYAFCPGTDASIWHSCSVCQPTKASKCQEKGIPREALLWNHIMLNPPLLWIASCMCVRHTVSCSHPPLQCSSLLIYLKDPFFNLRLGHLLFVFWPAAVSSLENLVNKGALSVPLVDCLERICQPRRNLVVALLFV